MIVLSFCLPLKEALFEGSGVTRSTSTVEGHTANIIGIIWEQSSRTMAHVEPLMRVRMDRNTRDASTTLSDKHVWHYHVCNFTHNLASTLGDRHTWRMNTCGKSGVTSHVSNCVLSQHTGFTVQELIGIYFLSSPFCKTYA